MSGEDSKQLYGEQKNAATELAALLDEQAKRNVGEAKLKIGTELCRKLSEVEGKIKKRDQNHPDYDLLGSHRAPAQMARLEETQARLRGELETFRQMMRELGGG